MKEFAGREGFYWWHGVVEDVLDPLKLGRCRVRVFGYHMDNKLELPTEDLPWAYPMQPVTSAAVSGIGTSPTGLLTGSHVFGFFRDGEYGQEPVIIGSFGGMPQRGPAVDDTGFSDPDVKYPVVLPEYYPLGVSKIGEPDTNRLATNGDDTTIRNTPIGLRKITRAKDIASTPDMKSSSKWSEPESPYAAEYPKNHVRFTESGHVQEFDDTPGSERIHTYHKSGSFSEIGNGYTENVPNGSKVEKIVGNDYEICYGDKKVYISGSDGLDVVVSGNVNLTIGGAANIQIDGTANIYARENANIKCGGFMKVSGKQMEFFSEENVAFSGKSISFISDAGVMVVGQDGKILMNSGEPVVRPKAVEI